MSVSLPRTLPLGASALLSRLAWRRSMHLQVAREIAVLSRVCHPGVARLLSSFRWRGDARGPAPTIACPGGWDLSLVW